MRLIFIGAIMLGLAGCQTVGENICSRKAELIGAAQATIEALRTHCPILDGENADTTEGENGGNQ